MHQKTLTKQYFSTMEVSKILHISRVAVLKKIKVGHLNAQKIGRNYIIAKEDIETILGSTISENQKSEIREIVQKAVKEYGVAFRRLGEER